jgi:hypothetical protein
MEPSGPRHGRFLRKTRQSLPGSFRSSEGDAHHAGRTPIALILVSMPIPVSVVIGRVEDLLNWPRTFAQPSYSRSYSVDRFPRSQGFSKKALKLEIAMCLLAVL